MNEDRTNLCFFLSTTMEAESEDWDPVSPYPTSVIYYWLFQGSSFIHYENTPIQLYWKFHRQKLKVFR